MDSFIPIYNTSILEQFCILISYLLSMLHTGVQTRGYEDLSFGALQPLATPSSMLVIDENIFFGGGNLIFGLFTIDFARYPPQILR